MSDQYTIRMDSETHKGLKVFCATWGLRLGDGMAALLALASIAPVGRLAACVARVDDEAGEIVPNHVTEGDYVDATRAAGPVEPECF